MILSFADARTRRFYSGGRVREFQPIVAQAARKLVMLDQATSLADLGSVPGNRLERLRGDRRSQHSIRINQQWRICFVWTAKGPAEVEIVDYH